MSNSSTIDLSKYDQVVEVYQNEADALCHSLRLYQYRLGIFVGYRQIYLVEMLSIRPTTRLLARLTKLVEGRWPRDRRQRQKPRKWRLEVEELVLLNRLYREEVLFPAKPEFDNPFYSILGKINQKALNLGEIFEL